MMRALSMRRLAGAGAIALSILAVGCTRAGAASTGRVYDAQRMRVVLGGRDAQALAPRAFAEADEQLRLARQAQAAGDTTSADLYAERALAKYNHAIAIARLSRAVDDQVTANEALGRAAEQAAKYAAERAAIDRQADDLEKKLRVAREAQQPPASGRADPERQRARVLAAQALVTQARLLCSAAHLVSPEASGLVDAETAVAGLEKAAKTSSVPAAIDPASRARAGCLASLTKARRTATASSDQTDTLLDELSQARASSGAAHETDGAPARDERGVVVTLRDLFKGDALTPEAKAALEDLARVAAAHPTFSLQIVLHDAQPPSPAEAAANQKRAEAIVRVLTAAGAHASKIKVEQAGASAPVVDPNDARRRERNKRLDVVFVSSS